MMNTKKGHTVRKLKNAHFIIYIISCVIIGVMAVLLVLVPVGRMFFEDIIKCQFFSWAAKKDCCFLGFVNFEGIKNVTMTIGLTGILFAWLLQVIGEKECGIGMDRLLSETFPKYVFLLTVFIASIVICIYFCSYDSELSNAIKLVTILAFLMTILGIVDMVAMCVCFLFDSEMRRISAFDLLEHNINNYNKGDTGWCENELIAWAKELPVCITQKESEAIETYFKLIYDKVSQYDNVPGKRLQIYICAEICSRAMTVTREYISDNQWQMLLPYVMKYKQTNAGYVMLASYIMQIVRKPDLNEKDFLRILKCLDEGLGRAHTFSADVFALYMAYSSIYEYAFGYSIFGNADIEAMIMHLKLDKLIVTTIPKEDYADKVLDTTLLCFGTTNSYVLQNLAMKYCTTELHKKYKKYLKLFSLQ